MSTPTTVVKDKSGLIEKAYESALAAGTVPNVPYIPVNIYPNFVEVNLMGITKTIHIDEFRGTLDILSGKNESKLSPIALPFGCFAFDRNDTSIQLSCYYPESIRKVSFKTSSMSKTFEIPFPNTIITFFLKKMQDKSWSVTAAYYFTTPKTVNQLSESEFPINISSTKGIHRLPFTNVYGDNKLCYGGNTMPIRHMDNLRGLDYYYQVLFLSPFNNDLGISGLKQRFTPIEWFEHLDGKDKFPYSMLS